jgi:hypothetical protein
VPNAVEAEVGSGGGIVGLVSLLAVGHGISGHRRTVGRPWRPIDRAGRCRVVGPRIIVGVIAVIIIGSRERAADHCA